LAAAFAAAFFMPVEKSSLQPANTFLEQRKTFPAAQKNSPPLCFTGKTPSPTDFLAAIR
jgi:hypothetical protein